MSPYEKICYIFNFFNFNRSFIIRNNFAETDEKEQRKIDVSEAGENYKRVITEKEIEEKKEIKEEKIIRKFQVN